MSGKAPSPVDLFLDMIAAERGAARNTIDAYRRDLADYADFLRQRGVSFADADTPVIRAYLRQLMDHAEAGTRPATVAREIDMPDELTDAMDADPILAEAFHALTPGRRKSYMFNLNQAKQSATRTARIEKFRERIIGGKGALER